MPTPRFGATDWAANGSDTCTVDAQLIGIRVKYTINAGDDT
jgi:hypothetical protein